MDRSPIYNMALQLLFIKKVTFIPEYLSENIMHEKFEAMPGKRIFFILAEI